MHDFSTAFWGTARKVMIQINLSNVTRPQQHSSSLRSYPMPLGGCVESVNRKEYLRYSYRAQGLLHAQTVERVDQK